MAHRRLRDTAHQQPTQPAAPMRPHDDEIHVTILGVMVNLAACETDDKLYS